MSQICPIWVKSGPICEQHWHPRRTSRRHQTQHYSPPERRGHTNFSTSTPHTPHPSPNTNFTRTPHHWEILPGIHSCHIWVQIGPDWHQIKQIWEISRSLFYIIWIYITEHRCIKVYICAIWCSFFLLWPNCAIHAGIILSPGWGLRERGFSKCEHFWVVHGFGKLFQKPVLISGRFNNQ